MSRDHAQERDLLTAAGGANFAATVIARIDVADVEYGDSFVWVGRPLLWHELHEEAIDAGVVHARGRFRRRTGPSYEVLKYREPRWCSWSMRVIEEILWLPEVVA